MEKEAFEAVVVEFGRRFSPEDNRIGQWLRSSYGYPVVHLSTGYGSRASVERLVTVVDTRTPGDVAEWTAQQQAAWCQRNLSSTQIAEDSSFVNAGKRGKQSAELLSLVRESVDWKAVGSWGPGPELPVRKERLERLQLLYFAARLSEQAYDNETSTSFLVGRNEALGFSSVLVQISVRGRLAGWPVIAALQVLLGQPIERALQ